MAFTMDTIVSLCKRRGFIFQNSEIYGGISNTWDYGPLGVELKNNVKRAWWKANVLERDDMEGLDAAIIMNPQVWKASGHLDSFSDPMVECKVCNRRHRADDLKTERCPVCGGQLAEARQFNLMFKTFIGPVESDATIAYLRPETAQGIFTNFINVQNSMHRKLPFGIAQIGKSFRNEITPGNFTFRTREFEQMEIEYFVEPGTDDEWFEHWVERRKQWYIALGIDPQNLRFRRHDANELAHYAKGCVDVDYKFPMGWSELEGIANRTDFDLRMHAQHSGKSLVYFDDRKREHYLPYVIEPSAGVDRSLLAFLIDAYHEEEVDGRIRTVLRLHKDLAPLKVAVLPLLKNRPEIVEIAKNLAADLRKLWMTRYDDTAGIGKLYRRQDEIGTPFCVTVDVDTLTDQAVTVRDRDTMAQERIPLATIKHYLIDKLA